MKQVITFNWHAGDRKKADLINRKNWKDYRWLACRYLSRGSLRFGSLDTAEVCVDIATFRELQT